MQTPSNREGELIAIPAVHYRAVFADRVNAVCRDENRRPDAVAVELGTSVVQAVIDWFRQLRVDRGERLPVMLGIMWRNRLLHPKYRETAIRLQREFGRPLHMLPKQVLQEYLNFGDSNLLCLSPTDSIIEAIRCGLELQIPVYGVDLEEMAPYEPVLCNFEDPLGASNDLDGYILRNMEMISKYRDVYVDSRRERVMASRIKHLLNRHKRLLFVCGLGHWSHIQGLLKDPSVRIAPGLPSPGAIAQKRVLVEPVHAVTQMDIYPNVSKYYEDSRQSAAGGCGIESTPINYASLLRDQLDAAYEKYLSAIDAHLDATGTRMNLRCFEDFLVRLCAVKQARLPGMSILLEAAEAISPDRFKDILMESLLSHEMEWSVPNEFPDLSILSSPSEKLQGDDIKAPAPSTLFVAGAFPSYAGSGIMKIPAILLPSFKESSAHHKMTGVSRQATNTWVWPPCEYIIYGTALEAAEKYKAEHTKRQTVAFEGSCEGGFDIRSTLRAMIRDDDTFYIRQLPRALEYIVYGGHAIEPSVFIFEDPEGPFNGDWDIGCAGFDPLRDFVEPEERIHFDRVVKTQGDLFVSWISISSRTSVPHFLEEEIRFARKLSGISIFGNPSANLKQSARWLKETRYRTCPVLQNSETSTLFNSYRSQFGIDLEGDNMTRASKLVMMAIPYARKRVIMVGPENFRIDPRIRKEARSRGISIDFVPLSAFPKNHITKMRIQYFVLTGSCGIDFSPSVEKLLGPKEAYLHRLPPAMQKQGS